MKAVLFDLDDTLYPEMDFVKSGFKVAAHYLSKKTGENEDKLFSQMLEILESEGRGKIFDILLRKYDIYSEILTRALVYLYRAHKPDIGLFDDVLLTINQLRQQGCKLGIITDGMASVQRGKIEALGISGLFDVIVYSDELGPDCWKPSTIPYLVALDLINAEPSDSVYVGDNDSKDFFGANQLGMLTIQVCRQGFTKMPNISLDENYHARFTAKDLQEMISFIGD